MQDLKQQAFSEFDLIARFFTPPARGGTVGVGDDCGIFSVQPGFQLAVSTDTLIEGRHFYADTDPEDLGHKALAVNLSDLSAVGARPRGCLLALSLPAVDIQWLEQFSAGFLALAQAADCLLIGGDTTRSVQGISMTVTVLGEVPIAQALLRNRALPEDDIWVTGALGGPFTALQMLAGRWPRDEQVLAQVLPRLQRPVPPYQWAPELIGHAHAAIDISDGLVQDLGHILQASQCGAELFFDRLPLHDALGQCSQTEQMEAALTGGDEFELCFTAPQGSRAYLLDSARKAGVAVERVGVITRGDALTVYGADGAPIDSVFEGFDHFS